MDDPQALDRFLAAQAPVIDTVRAELAAGAKRSHWMGFAFPKHAGRGHSQPACCYGIASRAEALANSTTATRPR